MLTSAGENPELRGFILSMCKINFPYGCSEELIDKGVNDNQFAASPAILAGHIEYLKEKGYVRVEKISGGGLRRTVVFITPQGIDLLEGNIPEDPGIMSSVLSEYNGG